MGGESAWRERMPRPLMNMKIEGESSEGWAIAGAKLKSDAAANRTASSSSSGRVGGGAVGESGVTLRITHSGC